MSETVFVWDVLARDVDLPAITVPAGQEIEVAITFPVTGLNGAPGLTGDFEVDFLASFSDGGISRTSSAIIAPPYPYGYAVPDASKFPLVQLVPWPVYVRRGQPASQLAATSPLVIPYFIYSTGGGTLYGWVR